MNRVVNIFTLSVIICIGSCGSIQNKQSPSEGKVEFKLAPDFDETMYNLAFQKELKDPDELSDQYEVFKTDNLTWLQLFPREWRKQENTIHLLTKKNRRYYFIKDENATLTFSIPGLTSIHGKELSPFNVKYGAFNYDLKIPAIRTACECHKYFAIGLFRGDECIWKYEDDLEAVIHSTVVDFDDDGKDEIVVFLGGHKPMKILVFETTYK